MNFKESVKRYLREKKGTKNYKFEKGKEWDMDDSEVDTTLTDLAKKGSSSLDKTKKWDTKKAKKSTEGIAKKHKFEKGKEWDMDDSEVSDIAKQDYELRKKRKK